MRLAPKAPGKTAVAFDPDLAYLHMRPIYDLCTISCALWHHGGYGDKASRVVPVEGSGSGSGSGSQRGVCGHIHGVNANAQQKRPGLQMRSEQRAQPGAGPAAEPVGSEPLSEQWAVST
jgi:hypothetical protein